jgi:hypothetical protein
MPLESGVTGIQGLNPAWPTGTDPKSQGDDHLRTIKAAIQASFPGMTGAWITGQIIKGLGYDATSARIINVGTATAATDAVTKAVTDALATRVTAIESQTGKFQSFGIINSNGTIRGGTGDFSVTKTGTGVYQINFTEAATLLDRQSVQVEVIGTAPFVGEVAINVNNDSVTRWTVYSFGSAGTAADLNFTFIRTAA